MSSKIARVPIFGVSTSRDGANTKDRRLVNCFTETLDENFKAVVKRPGYASATYDVSGSLSSQAARGCYYWEGNVYHIWGAKLFKGSSEIGTDSLTNTTGRCYFDVTEDGTKLLILEASGTSKLHTVTTSDTFATVGDAQFPTSLVSGVVSIDGYTVVMDSDGDVWNSVLQDETSWESTDFLNANLVADGGTAIARHVNYLAVLGSKSLEFYQDAGNPSASPFKKLSGTASLIGCAAGDTVLNIEKTLFWVGQAQGGGRFVAALEGLQPVGLSSKPVEEALDAEGSNISSAYALYFRIGGHSFYAITLPTTQAQTWVYDITEGEWSQWKSGSSGTWDIYDVANGPGTVYAQTNGAGDGLIHTLLMSEGDDNGTTIEVEATTEVWDDDNLYTKEINRATVVGDQYGTDTTDVGVSWTDDDYQNFTSSRTVDLNDKFPNLTRCGSTRRRAHKLTFQEDSQMRIRFIELAYTTSEQYGME